MYQKNYYYNYIKCNNSKRCKNLNVMTIAKMCIVGILKGMKTRHFMAMLEYFENNLFTFLNIDIGFSYSNVVALIML